MINVAVPAAAAALEKKLRRDTGVVKPECSLFTVVLLFGKSLVEAAKFRGEQENFCRTQVSSPLRNWIEHKPQQARMVVLWGPEISGSMLPAGKKFKN